MLKKKTWWTHVGCCLAIVLTLAALWAPVAQFEFLNFDDNDYVTDNAFVRTGLSWENIRWAFTQTHAGHWHPLTWLSHMLDCSLFGMNAGAHHVHNLVLHIGVVLLLYALVWRVARRYGLALLIALTLGVHPLRLESVAWVTERKDLLSMLWGMITLHAYMWWAARPSWPRYGAILAVWLVSLLCKPTFITLPLLLLCCDAWPLQRIRRTDSWNAWWPRLREKIPMLVMAAGFSIVVLWAQSRGGGLRSADEYALADRLANVWVGYLTYAAKLLLPVGQGVFYPFAYYAPGVGVGAACAVIFITASAWRARMAQPALWFAWSWYLIALLPMIGLVPIGGQAFADRWSYLPHVGLLWGGLAWALGRSQWHRIRWLAVVAIIIFAGMTAMQLPHWKNSETIFRHTLRLQPANFMAHTNLGVAREAQGDLADASLHYEEAVRLNPTYPEAVNNLGSVRAQLGKMVEAEQLFVRALRVRPAMPTANFNVGLLYSQTDRPWQAVRSLWRAGQLGFSPAWDSLQIMVSRVQSQCGQAVTRTPEEVRARMQIPQLLAPQQNLPLAQKLLQAAQCQ